MHCVTVSRFWSLALPGLLGLAACGRLLDFSEVTGGSADAGATADAAADTGTGGDSAANCSGGQTDCGGQCVDLATDKNHCGACNTDCGGGECTASKCQPFGLSKIECHSVATDDTGSFVYVTRYREPGSSDGGVYKIDLKTGEATGMALGYAGAAWLVVAGNAVFWTTELIGSSDRPQAVWRLDLSSSGATPTQLYPNSGDTTLRRPFGLSVDGNFVYFADKNGAIGRAPLGGGGSELLYTSLPGTPLNLDVLDPWIYYTELNTAPNTGAVRRVPLVPATPPDPPEDVLPGLEGAWGVIARDLPLPDGGTRATVFASIAGGAVIAAANATGGFFTTTVSNQTGGAAPAGADITLVGDQLYWATRYGIGGSIQTYQLEAIGNATEFASSKEPIGIASVGDFLYWCSLKDGLTRARL